MRRSKLLLPEFRRTKVYGRLHRDCWRRRDARLWLVRHTIATIATVQHITCGDYASCRRVRLGRELILLQVATTPTL